MVNEDILGGIETAVSRGESIESVMRTFYNSGYSKEDIEWAAKAFQLKESRKSVEPVQQKPKIVPIIPVKEKPLPEQFMKKPFVRQNVSNYEQASQFKERIILIVLISSLLLLLGILAAVFLFRTQLVNFINSLFG